MDPTTPAPDPVWTFRTGGALFAGPAVAGEVVYVGSSDGHVYAVDRRTGRERWRFRTHGAVDATPAVADGLVVFPSRDGRFYALESETGVLRWRFRTGGETRHDFWDFHLSDPVVAGDRVFVGSGDGHLYAVELQTGELAWRHRAGGMVHGAPVVEDGRVFYGDFGGGLHALDSRSGELLWSFQAEGNEHFPRGEFQRGPVLLDGVVYVGSRDYHLYAVDARDGQLLWKQREAAGWVIATPLPVGDHLLFGVSDGQHFYSVDRRSGQIRWSVPVHSRVFGSAVEVGGLVAFGGFNGKALALDPHSGEVRWSFQTPASRRNLHRVYDEAGALTAEMRELYRSGRGMEAEERILELGSIAGTPAVHDRTLYFGTTEGLLYAVEVDVPR
jgi:eukaryotic-like serine/threonine-protein kinase